MKHIVKYAATLFLCALVLLALVACGPSELSYEEQKAAYDGIIEEYTALLTAIQNGEELPAADTDGKSEEEAAISAMLREMVDGETPESVADSGYGFKDMDGNGTPELILLKKYTIIRAIFTVKDLKPILLESAYNKYSSCVFATDNRFFLWHSNVDGNIRETTHYTCRVDGDKMIYDSIYGLVMNDETQENMGFFQMVNDERITIDRETYKELNREHAQASRDGISDTMKMLTPYIHLPLADKVPTENLPVADFSSYEAIRETYKAISTCVEDFQRHEWRLGKYDDLFSYPDDRSFEYYNRLLYVSELSIPYKGYDEIDLNGDGVDELVLLTEGCNIDAIFTQRNGTPVLLDTFPNEQCWLDEEGLIHVDRIDVYEIEYSLYEFTKEGDYHLVYSILAAENGNRYLTKDGKTEIIPFEDSLTLYYDEYRRYTEPFDAHEYTRSVSGLTYTPLTLIAEDPVQAAVTKTWYKYAELHKTSGEEHGAWSMTYVTFENVTDTQLDVHIRYEYAVLYPDPDCENHLLDQTTDSYLDFTARKENGVYAFEADGIKGHLEFDQLRLWLVIEESTDKRFPVGYHRYQELVPESEE